jgi:predicted transposase/invertase (TIGR01784 family)
MKETLYSRRSNLVVGFHGCDQSIKEQVFEHLARLVAVADLSEENRIAYDKALDRYRVNQIVEEDERRKNEEMRRKAAEEGIREGIKEGMEKGMEKGEQKKQIEIARKMREDGISIDTIIKYTGLQSSDIENL